MWIWCDLNTPRQHLNSYLRWTIERESGDDWPHAHIPMMLSLFFFFHL